MALLVIFVVLAIPWTYFNITLGLKLERELEAIRERGEPLTLEQALPETPPREQNAAYVYEQVFHVFREWEGARADAAPGTPLRELEDEMSMAVAEFVSGERPELAPAAREWLFSDDMQRRLEAIRRASQMERCVFPVNWEDGFAALLPQFAHFHVAQRLVAARMMLAARAGDTDGALQWCEVSLRMAEHAGQEPTLIAFLVRVAMQDIAFRGAEQILTEVAVPPDQARRLRGIVSSEGLWENFDRAMLGERVLGLWAFEHISSGMVAEMLEDPAWAATWKLYRSVLARPVRGYDQLAYLRLMGEQLAFLDQPYREVARASSPVEERIRDVGWLAPITQMLVPAFSRAQTRRDQAIAELNQFQIALMLNVYRQEYGGYPRTLDELAEAVDWEPPDDIFSGEPFLYRREGEGYVLWSLGPDLDDDGGHGHREEGRSWDDSDIVWRAEG